MQAGAEAVLEKINKGVIRSDDVAGSVFAISQISEEVMGGTSGALYSIFFSGLSQSLQTAGGDTVTPQIWAQALKAALDNLYTYTRARPPSRTLVDPLSAFINAISASAGNNFSDAVRAASQAAEATKNLEAKAGRSAYVEGDRLKQEQIPDPGAWGIKTILENINA
ncbi:Dihydroxyacetone kinase [Leucoagaricus sp. SymC.cos]|nr:Dihydroxyacetone kinase [Leucoagaricus sp. SymC.cos]